MNFRKHRPEEVSLNLTPLIDVVFLLLIFFMVSTTFTKESRLEIDLPESQASQQLDNQQRLEIVIDRTGHYFVNGRKLVQHDFNTLQQALIEEAKQGDPQVVIAADKDTPYQAYITAMDAASKSGLTKISMATNQPTSE